MTDDEGQTKSGGRRNGDFMFPTGAPDVGIGTLDIWRATITHTAHDFLVEDEQEQALSWTISGFAASDRFVLVGDLSCRGSGWFVATTAICLLDFRSPEGCPKDDPDSERDAAQLYGAWASNVLYDTAASRARSLIASSNSCHIDVPVLTPKAKFGKAVSSDADVLGV